MKVQLAALACAHGLLSACGDKPQTEGNIAGGTTAPTPVVSLAAPVLPAPTAEDWKKALEAALPPPAKSSDILDEKDGVSSFSVCVKRDANNKCDVLNRVTRDTFRKLRHIESISSRFAINQYKTNVNTYVSVLDNRMPVLFLAAYFQGDNSWLFMEKLAIMVEGEVVLEQTFEHSDVKREASGGEVEELAQFIVQDEQLAALRKIAKGKAVLIRMTGEKGYVSLPKSQVAALQEALVETLFTYDFLVEALKGKIPPGS